MHESESFMIFPDPRRASEDGLLCWGGELTTQTLIDAYSKGIFPWPQEGYPMLWFSPQQRGIIEFKDFHISKSLARDLKRSNFEVSFDQAFSQVILGCQKAKRAHEKGTWISPEIVHAYMALHEAGYAHSVECWQDKKLVGGLYGVFVGGVFSGESMFYLVDNASKFCLIQIIELLKKKSLTWIDTQMITPLVKNFGGKYIEREEYLTWHLRANKQLKW
jgi:leucyl/phenylalanyl-tRNA--protein transferase